MDMAKKWVKLGGLGRSRRQSNRSCGDEVTCFNLRAPRGFRADSLPKIYFREAPIDVPDVVASDSVAADEVNAVKHASDVALSSPSNSHRLGPSSSSSADLSSFDLPNLESAEPSPAVEPATGRRGSPDGTQTCPERSLTGDDVEFCSRRAKTVPLDTHSAHSRRTGPRRSLTDQRGSERIGDGTVTETTTPAQRAFELAPVAEPCSPAIAGRPAPPVSTGLSRLMADLYGGEEDDSVGEGDLYGVAVLPASSKSGRRASISGGTGGFGGSSRRIAWEGANGDDYLSYPEDLYAVAFRSGPLPPSRSPAAFSRGGGGGGGGAGGPPARSPLSRNATMHMVPKQRSRRTFSQPSDFPGFQQDLGGSSSSAIGGCSLPRRSLTQPKLRAPSDPDLTGPSDTRAAGGQAYAEASIPEASTPESLFRGESSRGGSHRKGSFRGRPSEDQTSPLTADPTGVCYDSSSRGAGGQRRRGSASGREIGGGVRTPPAEGHRRIPSGASYDGREGGFEGEVRLKERAEGHRRNPSGASYDGIGAGEIDDELNGGDSREGFGSCAVTPKGGRVARRANASPLPSPHAGASFASPLTSPHTGASHASPLVSPHAGVDRVDLFQHYQHNRNPRGWTSPHVSAHSGPLAPTLNPVVEGATQTKQARRRSIEVRDRGEISRSSNENCLRETRGARSGKLEPTYALGGSLSGALGGSAEHRHRRQHSASSRSSSSRAFPSALEHGSSPTVTFVSPFQRHIASVAEAERLDQIASTSGAVKT